MITGVYAPQGFQLQKESKYVLKMLPFNAILHVKHVKVILRIVQLARMA